MVKIITIDGPSGAGKGTLCHLIAQELNWHILDSGVIYRAFALNAAQSAHDAANLSEAEITDLANLDLKFSLQQDASLEVSLNGCVVTDELRSEACAQGASKMAAMPAVRAALLQWQRDFAREPGLVTDGRDMGTVVFPNASLKLFVTASPEQRAERRHKQLFNKGLPSDFDSIVESIRERDARDAARETAPLKPAEDAICIDTSSKSIADVFEEAMIAVRRSVT